MGVESGSGQGGPKALLAMMAFMVPQAAVPADARESVDDQASLRREMTEKKRATDADYLRWRELIIDEGRGNPPSLARKALEKTYGETVVLGWIHRFYVTDAEHTDAHERDKSLFWEAGEKFIRLLKYRDDILPGMSAGQLREEIIRLYAENTGTSARAPELAERHWNEQLSRGYGEYLHIFLVVQSVLGNELLHDPDFYAKARASDYTTIRDVFAIRVPETQRISPVRAYAEDLVTYLDRFFALTEGQRLEIMYRGQLEALSQ